MLPHSRGTVGLVSCAALLILVVIACALRPVLAETVSNADLVKYRVEPPRLSTKDLSGAVGERLIKLLRIQAGRNLAWLQAERKKAGSRVGEFEIPVLLVRDISREYNLLQAVDTAYLCAVLNRCDQSGEAIAAADHSELARISIELIHAAGRTHPVCGNKLAQPTWWDKHWTLRIDYNFGMAAWLLWDKLDPQTQLLVARILEYDADLYIREAAPARLYDDTQAESNAWTAGGIALAYCMLKQHPHRQQWGAKAKEFMISAYATQQDVASSKLVDGKPLKDWLRAPNALADYTVENHGFIHPDYMAAVSEQVRSAICYRLAGEPVPEAVTFNAAKVYEVLTVLNMPAGNHLYVQGTDYVSRRLDSFLQTCNLLPLEGSSLGEACFQRVLGSIEKMAAERVGEPMSGWIGMNQDFGSTWGLTENYLMRRLFGSAKNVLPEAKIEEKLVGVRVFEPGQFAVHRTARTISSFSWHATVKSSEVMGLTMPLDKDQMVYPMPGSGIGELFESQAKEAGSKSPPLKVVSHRVGNVGGGLTLLLDLMRCSGRVQQNCAFISLPDGISVYIEERLAKEDVSLASASSGNVVINDDVRWVYQKQPRAFYGAVGKLGADADATYRSSWVNVDDRLGFVAVGTDRLHVLRSPGTPAVWRGAGTIYGSCRLEFLQPTGAGSQPAMNREGQRIGVFALITCPNQTRSETSALAEAMRGAGWLSQGDGVLSLRVGTRVVYANFADGTAGWR